MIKNAYDTQRTSQILHDVSQESGVDLAKTKSTVDAYQELIAKYIANYGGFYIRKVGLLHARKTHRIEGKTGKSWNFLKIAFRPARDLKELVNGRPRHTGKKETI